MPLGAAQKARIDETMGSEVSKRSGENLHSTGFAYYSAERLDSLCVYVLERFPMIVPCLEEKSIQRRQIMKAIPLIPRASFCLVDLRPGFEL